MELYNHLGFTANPFSTFSAEEEKASPLLVLLFHA